MIDDIIYGFEKSTKRMDDIGCVDAMDHTILKYLYELKDARKVVAASILAEKLLFANGMGFKPLSDSLDAYKKERGE